MADGSTRGSRMSRPPTTSQVDNLEKMLMIGEKGAVADGGGVDGGGESSADPTTPTRVRKQASGLLSPTPVSKEAAERFVAAASGIGGRRSQSSHGSNNVQVKGYKLSPDDLMSMDEGERIAILMKVKEGAMTMDEAMAEIIEHKKRQNCVVM